MEMINLKILRGNMWFYGTTYANPKDFYKAYGLNMPAILDKRYESI